MKTPEAQRKAKERAVRKAAGFVLVSVWVKPEDREAVKALAKELNKKHLAGSGE